MKKIISIGKLFNSYILRTWKDKFIRILISIILSLSIISLEQDIIYKTQEI